MQDGQEKLDKLTTKMQTPHHTLHKSAKVADYYLPYFFRYPKHCSVCAVNSESRFDRYATFPVWRRPAGHNLAPTAQARTWLPGNAYVKGNPPFSKCPPLLASPLCLQFTKAAKQSQPPSQFGGPDSSPLCYLPCCAPAYA